MSPNNRPKSALTAQTNFEPSVYTMITYIFQPQKNAKFFVINSLWIVSKIAIRMIWIALLIAIEFMLVVQVPVHVTINVGMDVHANIYHFIVPMLPILMCLFWINSNQGNFQGHLYACLFIFKFIFPKLNYNGNRGFKIEHDQRLGFRNRYQLNLSF